MKRYLLFLLFASLLCVESNAKVTKVEINKITYEVDEFGVATCAKADKSIDVATIESSVSCKRGTYKITAISDVAFENCTKLKLVKIPETITYVGRRAFRGCKSLQNIVLPNSLKKIGFLAFENCSSMSECVLPEGVKSEKYKINNTVHGPFFGCTSLSDVRGLSSKYPIETIEATFTVNDKVPFMDELPKVKETSFSCYAQKKITEQMSFWETKKEYETIEEYQTRMTGNKRQEALKKIISDVKQEFLNEKSTLQSKPMLGSYDSQYGIYKVDFGNGGISYAKVPATEAEAFRTKWDKITIDPVYGVINDQLAILSCTFTLGDKTYESADVYKNDYSASFIAYGLTQLDMSVGDDVREKADESKRMTSKVTDRSIDTDIPVVSASNDNTYAVIIGNEKYSNPEISDVPFAQNDAKVFAQYCNKTLGIPNSNIREYYNATFATILTAIDDIRGIAEVLDGKLDIIFYYAGHGIPDFTSQQAYLLPVDGSASQFNVSYPVAKLYDELGSMGANSVIVFLDACFSGSKRGKGMIAEARGVVIKPKECVPSGNTVVFSAASGDETAMPYAEKGHGMFTYYLLSKLKESRGEVTLGELGDYIISNVKLSSIRDNRQRQTPDVIPSDLFIGDWKTKKLR